MLRGIGVQQIPLKLHFENGWNDGIEQQLTFRFVDVVDPFLTFGFKAWNRKELGGFSKLCCSIFERNARDAARYASRWVAFAMGVCATDSCSVQNRN